MYIRKNIQKEIENLNNYVKEYGTSKGFYNFIEENKKYVAIKNKNKCTCSNCNCIFETNNKVNEYEFCPKCNKKLLLKRSSFYEEKDYVIYLIKYGDDYIMRNYEIDSYYTKHQEKMKHIVTEYGRQVIRKNGILGLQIMINTMRRNTSGYWYINYIEKVRFWKPEHYISSYGKCYVEENVLVTKYFNPKELLDNTEIDICKILKGIDENNYVLEMLIKSKLYNLAAEYYEFKNGSFEEVFGVDKSYYNFMKENNITSRELETLKKIKIKDYELIKYLSETHRLDELLETCKPYDLYKYKINSKDSYMYNDYILMAKKLGMDLSDKKILYPMKLKEEHDALQNIIQTAKDKQITKKIKSRYNKIKNNIYQDKKYIIYPVKSVEEMIEESNQQNNCVKTYAERMAKGECDIYFMRLLKEPTKSLVTVEVRNNTVVQQRIKNNADTLLEQKRFLKKWEKTILNHCGG